MCSLQHTRLSKGKQRPKGAALCVSLVSWLELCLFDLKIVFPLQSAFHHKCEYWTLIMDKRGAFKFLRIMLTGDPNRPVEVPFTEAKARLWSNFGIPPNVRIPRCVPCCDLFNEGKIKSSATSPPRQ